MLDQYKDACARLTLGQEKLEEMITMTENKPKKRLSRPVKTILIAAACLAALTLTAFAASPAGREAIRNIVTVKTVRVFPAVQSYTEDGHTFLVVDDETIDLTQELEENGSYTLELEDGVSLDVDGEGWVTMRSEDNNISYSFRPADGPVSDVTPRVGLVQVVTDEDGSVSAEADTPGSVTGSYRLELGDGILPAEGDTSDSAEPFYSVDIKVDDPGSVEVFDYVTSEADDPDQVGVYDFVAAGADSPDGGIVINYVTAE